MAMRNDYAILMECMEFISKLPVEQVPSARKIKWVNAFMRLKGEDDGENEG